MHELIKLCGTVPPARYWGVFGKELGKTDFFFLLRNKKNKKKYNISYLILHLN
jgi:hypothetical protein